MATPQGESGIVSPQNPTGAIFAAPAGGFSTTPTAAQSGVGNPTGNGNYGPTVGNPNGSSTGANGVVTTNRYPVGSAPTASAGSPTSAAGIESTAYSTAQAAAAQSPQDIEANISALYAQEIAGIQAQYNAMINSQTKTNENNTGQVRAAAAASGALGSAAGASDIAGEDAAGNAALGNLSAEEQAAEGAVTDKEAAAALGQYQANQTNLTAAAATEAGNVTANAAAALTQMQQMAGTTPLNSLDSTTYNTLLTQSGLTEQQFQTLYNAYGVAAAKPNTQVLQGGDGQYYMISTNPTTNAVESVSNLGLPASPVSVAAGAALYDPTTGTIVAQGQDKPTSIPVAGSAAYAAPATAAGGNAAAGGAPGGATAAPGTTPGASSAPTGAGAASGAVTPPGTPAAQGGGSGASASAIMPDGSHATWASLGINAANAKTLIAIGQTPDTIYNQAYAAILGGSTTSASSGGMGSGAAIGSIKSGAISAAASSILAAYGLTTADLPAIAAQNQGLSTSLENMIGMKSSITQYITKTSSNLKTLQGTISQYGSQGSPLINEALQAIQKNVTGDPSLTALTDAMIPFLNEYAKVMQGSTGSVSGATVNSQSEAAELLAKEMNKGQLNSGISVMVQDMAGQLNSVNGSVSELSQNVGSVIASYAQSKGWQGQPPSFSNKTVTIQGKQYPVGDAVSLQDPQGNTNLYLVEPDSTFTPL